MATTTSPTPHRAVIGPTHPTYDTWAPIWQRLAHVAEGSGGFLDGTYLIAHPREWDDHTAANPKEPSKKLKERRTLARYEDLAGFILDQKRASLFREPPTRRFVTPGPAGAPLETHPYLDWTANVDGAGTSLDAFLTRTMGLAFVFGHAVIVMDRATDDGPTAADKAALVLRAYTPLDMVDWLEDPTGQRLTAVKLVEDVQRTTLAASPALLGLSHQVREITADEAIVYTVTGQAGGTSERATVKHAFGVPPVALLFAHRRALLPLVGKSALSDPQLFIDLFNLTSEVRELLRKQTFSTLNIPLGVNADGGPSLSIEDAQTMLGQTTGTANVMFSGLPAQYVSADTSNVTVYQAEREQLVRLIFRLCGVPYDSDSRDAESAESRRLKRADFTTALQGYADELTAVERQIARLWCRGTYGPEGWEREWDRVTFDVAYPRTYDDASFEDVLAQASAVAALPLSESKTFTRAHAETLVPVFLPNATPDMQAAIRAELEAAPTPEEKRQEQRDDMAARLKAGPMRSSPMADPEA